MIFGVSEAVVLIGAGEGLLVGAEQLRWGHEGRLLHSHALFAIEGELDGLDVWIPDGEVLVYDPIEVALLAHLLEGGEAQLYPLTVCHIIERWGHMPSKGILATDHGTALVALLFDLGHDQVFVLDLVAAAVAVVTHPHLSQCLLIERQHLLHLHRSPPLYVLVLFVFFKVLLVLGLFGLSGQFGRGLLGQL
jgi:hypothetical protein